MMLLQSLVLVYVLYNVDSSAHRWPSGEYGLPKSKSGCPLADGFQWQTGWRYQDTNDHDDQVNSNNSRSKEFHIDGNVTKIIVNRSFCMKDDTNDDKGRPMWPQGKYCIYKGKAACPDGLTRGNVFWSDDEMSDWNKNDAQGRYPDGQYWTSFTLIRFCCQTKGIKNHSILLPTKSPFYLLPFESAQCQMVKWAVSSLEWIYYRTSGSENQDRALGHYPYNAGKQHPTIYYCYYRGCNKTLNADSGTLHSPNHPRGYPNGQYCSWRITVNGTKRIHLKFAAFSLQSGNNTDVLYVYDGKDTSAKLLDLSATTQTADVRPSAANHIERLHIPKGTSTRHKTSQRQEGSKLFTGTTGISKIPLMTSSTPAQTGFSITPTRTSFSRVLSGQTPRSMIMWNQPMNITAKVQTRQGIHVLAVVVPVVTVIVAASLFVGVLFYCKRKRVVQDTGREERICLRCQQWKFPVMTTGYSISI
ncbi:uncharacterized protein LOC114962877 isoform X3 [Acropora millepora]|uniref:uncharacterized protein LOC114962877 isoform X3 n=1 Tax=Acropora millepora TaxID=45264 RepID=UPI001CF57461|nr:uncharacterized protein LOC114962877 isoform X3 [Acropora millepora]